MSNLAPQPIGETTIAFRVPVGMVLQCDPRSANWTTAPGGSGAADLNFTFTQQWLRDDVPIAGARGELYTTAAADVGHAIDCETTAKNSHGSTTIRSGVPVLVV